MSEIFSFANYFFRRALEEEYKTRIRLTARVSEFTGGEALPPAYAAIIVKEMVKRER